MQKAYISALGELAKNDKNVLSLLADSGTGYDQIFYRYYPDQVLDFGIAEENMVAAAAGMASCGKIPFVYTAGAFLAYRSYEFIRDDVCFQNQNVKIVGMGAGLSWSTLGTTHHTTEDLGILRSLPNLTIFSPSCPREVEKVVKESYAIKGPVYIKIEMNNEPDIYEKDYEFVVGKNVTIKDGTDITIYATGSIISEVLKVAELLELDGISAKIINVHTIKPFDKTNVLEEVKNGRSIFSVEEQSIYGGIGSIIGEIIAESGIGVMFKRIGLDTNFAKGYGTHEQVRSANGLDKDSIYKLIVNTLNKE